jgi:hypothetical protein
MRHLMGPAIDFLYAPKPELKAVMLASLYEDPNASKQSVINAWSQSSVKFYVNNYRMRALPHEIKNYLNSQYAHWWGSIYLYAPLVSKGRQTIALKFPGEYQLESTKQQSITINGHAYQNGAILHLEKNHITSIAPFDYRLKLIPNMDTPSAAFQKDDWDKVMF